MRTAETSNGAATAGLPAVRRPRFYSVADLEVIAKRSASSALFGMNQDQAFTLMAICQSEGLDAVQALKRYHVIQGRPAMRADAMQAEFQRRGGQMRWLRTTAEECLLEAWHPHLHPEHLTFGLTIQELVESGVALAWDRDKKQYVKKENYCRFPRQMMRARCISEAVRAIDPGTVVGIYTPEEVTDFAVEDRGPAPAIAAATTPAPASAPPAAPLAGAVARGRRDQPEREADDEADREWKGFIRREIKAATEEFEAALREAGRPRPERRDLVCNGFQVVNHLCTLWIDDGLMEAEAIAGPDGRRDRGKATEAVRTAFREYPPDVKEEVQEYVADKLQEAYREAGIEPARPGDRDEAQATADEEPAAEAG